MTSPKPPIIIAGSRPWNIEEAAALLADYPGESRFASTPDELESALQAIPNARYLFFIHWSSLVPARITERYECVCFHMTDVPYGRGGSPLQNLIARGHRDTKMTALRMTPEIDAGPVYLKDPLSLEGGSAEEIFLRASRLSCDMIRTMLTSDIEPVPQSGGVTAFSRRTPDQSELPTDTTLLALHDHIRMLDAEGYPRAFLEVGNLRLEFDRSSLQHGQLQANVKISLLSESQH